VTYLDATKRIHGRPFFVDPIHLNSACSARFTRLLAPELERPAGG
jgi:hypothetical protein